MHAGGAAHAVRVGNAIPNAFLPVSWLAPCAIGLDFFTGGFCMGVRVCYALGMAGVA